MNGARETERERGHLLVVDDDDGIRRLLRDWLKAQGFRVTEAANAAKARARMAMMDFDLIVLDVMMPGEDGFSLTAAIRQTAQTPILLLTARGDPGDRIRGLSLGADDYLAKPFEPEELVLRIEAILRRAAPRARAARVAFGGWTYDLDAQELRRGQTRVRLTGGEAALLTALAARPGEPVSREALAARTSGGEERSVDVQVARLRRKIEPDPRAPVHLQTVRGAGYRLAAHAAESEVTAIAANSEAVASAGDAGDQL